MGLCNVYFHIAVAPEHVWFCGLPSNNKQFIFKVLPIGVLFHHSHYLNTLGVLEYGID